MLAFLAALVIGFDLLVKPHTTVPLWEVGLLLLALHHCLDGPLLARFHRG